MIDVWYWVGKVIRTTAGMFIGVGLVVLVILWWEKRKSR